MKTAARRLSRASRGAWLDGEVEDDVAELLDSKRGRGGGGGRGNGVRLRRWCSGGRAEENQRRREIEGEGETSGWRVASRGASRRQGGEAGGGRERGPGRTRGRARRRVPLSFCRRQEDDGWRLGQWAAPLGRLRRQMAVGKRQVSFLFLFLSYFSDICLV